MSRKRELTKEQAVGLLIQLQSDDREAAHAGADRVLLDVLRSNGLGDVADAYEELKRVVGGFWYA